MTAGESDSPMATAKNVMTVQQLIDLTAFLQDATDIRTPRRR
jgi:hypothetical protein